MTIVAFTTAEPISYYIRWDGTNFAEIETLVNSKRFGSSPGLTDNMDGTLTFAGAPVNQWDYIILKNVGLGNGPTFDGNWYVGLVTSQYGFSPAGDSLIKIVGE